MKKFTELLKVLLIVGALTTFGFSTVADEVAIFCEPTPAVCAEFIEVTDLGYVIFIDIIVIEGHPRSDIELD